MTLEPYVLLGSGNETAVLRDILETVLREYPRASKEPFKNHSFAIYVRDRVPNILNEALYFY